MSLEPPQEQYAWGTPDAEYEGWTSLAVNPDDPALPSYTFYSKLVDGPKGHSGSSSKWTQNQIPAIPAGEHSRHFWTESA